MTNHPKSPLTKGGEVHVATPPVDAEGLDQVAERINAGVAQMDASQKIDPATWALEINPNASPLPSAVAPTGDGISWTALLSVLERLRSKNRNPDNEWYHGWNAAIQCLINDVNARAAPPVAAPENEQDHERLNELLDALPDYPTEEQAEEVLRAAGTSGKEVANVFIERLLRENLELKTKLAATTQSSDQVARAAAEEIADRWSKHDLPVSAGIHSNPTLQLRALAAHVLTKHLRAAAVSVDDDAEKR